MATAALFVARTPLYVGGIPAGKAKAHIPVRAWWSHGIALSRPVPRPMALPHACCFLAPLHSLWWPLFAGCIGLQLRRLPEEPPAGREAPGSPLAHLRGDAVLRGRAGERGLLCCGGRVRHPRYPTAAWAGSHGPWTGRDTSHGRSLVPLFTSSISLAADAVATEQDLEVTLEVRPRSASGLIFHLGTRRSHHLLLYMEEMKVGGGWLPHRFSEAASISCPSRSALMGLSRPPGHHQSQRWG